MIAEHLPKARAILISNGSLITREHLKFLADLHRPPTLTVDDYTPDHRIKRRLLAWQEDLKPRSINFLDIRERSWGENLSNRAGNQPDCKSVASDYHDIVCTWPFTGLFLNPELKAFLCCSDYAYDVIVGDLTKESVMDIWGGACLTKIRAMMLTSQCRNLPLCRKCDAEWFCLPDHCAK